MRLIRILARLASAALVAAAIGGHDRAANADDLKIRSPIIETHELEFENNFVFGRGKTTVHELEYGVTDWLKPGLELELKADPGQGLHYDATALETFVQLTPQGKYWADLGLFAEYEMPGRTGDPRSLMIGPLIQKETPLFGLNTLHTINALFTKQIGAGSVGVPGVLLAAQSRLRLNPYFEPGVEYYGTMSLGDHGDDPEHRIGPMFAGRIGFREFGLNTPGGVKYDAAYLRGLNNATDRNTVRLRVELEFPL